MKTVLPLAFALALAPVQLVRAQAPAIRGKTPSAHAKAFDDGARRGARSARIPAP